MELRVDRLEPAATPLEQLQEAVLASVLQRTSGRIRDLAVTVSDGVVTLTGTTSRYYYKQLATTGVQDGCFGLEVENEISVGIR